MPQFTYVAVDSKGKEQKGNIQADNKDDAASKLKAKGLYPSSLEESGKRVAAAAAAAENLSVSMVVVLISPLVRQN